MARLSQYVDFVPMQAAGTSASRSFPGRGHATRCQSASSRPACGPDPAWMSLLTWPRYSARARLISESTGDNGLKTQIYEYHSGDRKTEVTFVEGTVVKFAITSE